MKKTFEVTENEAGQTLVATLRAWLPGQSWSQIRKLLSGRRVRVSGTLTLDEGRRLTLGEQVELFDQPAPPPPRATDVRIVHVDAELVVVDKPAGMKTLRHASERGWPEARKGLQPTLDEAVARLLTERERRTRQPRRLRRHRVRSVHRLDRDTSGLLVFARSAEAERSLVEQFSAHTVDRVYHAVVEGSPPAQRIETRLVRDRGDGLRGSTGDPQAGKPAITHIRPLEALGAYTLVECRLETGRTHQIRIHLSEQGYPVCGETKYTHPLGGTPRRDPSRAPRLALHAAELGFTHPATGERLHFAMPLPPELERFVERLRTLGATGVPPVPPHKRS